MAVPVPALSDLTTTREIWAISSGLQILYRLYYHRIRDKYWMLHHQSRCSASAILIVSCGPVSVRNIHGMALSCRDTFSDVFNSYVDEYRSNAPGAITYLGLLITKNWLCLFGQLRQINANRFSFSFFRAPILFHADSPVQNQARPITPIYSTVFSNINSNHPIPLKKSIRR